MAVNGYTVDALASGLGLIAGGSASSAGGFGGVESCTLGGKVWADGGDSGGLEDFELVPPNGSVTMVVDAEVGVLGVGVGQVESDLDGVRLPVVRLPRKAVQVVPTTNCRRGRCQYKRWWQDYRLDSRSAYIGARRGSLGS